MTLVLNTNVPAILANRRLGISNAQVNRSMERLASGQRINRAADDAAGLNLSQNLSSQVVRLKQALRNTQDGVSIVQVAEGAMTTMMTHLQRVRELAVQASNDTYSETERDSIENEIKARLTDMDRIALSTDFNGNTLLNGFYDGVDDFAHIQIGANSEFQTNVLDLTPIFSTGVLSGDPVHTPNVKPTAVNGIHIVGAPSGPVTPTFADIDSIDLVDNLSAQNFLSDVDRAMQNLSNTRSAMGAYQNQMEAVMENLTDSIENLSASNSRIKDVDIAEESALLTQYQVLQNASVSVLSQANRLPQMILGLLEAR